AHRRVLDLLDARDELDPGVDDARGVLEERWQAPTEDEAVLVDRRREHAAAVDAVPGRVVGSAAEEGDAERRARDDHPAPNAGSNRARSIRSQSACSIARWASWTCCARSLGTRMARSASSAAGPPGPISAIVSRPAWRAASRP